MGKKHLPTSGSEKLSIGMKKKQLLTFYLTPSTKINFRSIVDLKVKATMKYRRLSLYLTKDFKISLSLAKIS